LTEPEQKTWLNYFSSNGYTDPNGKGKTIDVLTGMETIGKSKELTETMLGPRVENMKQDTIAAYSALQEAIAKNPEDKKIPELQAAYKKASMGYLGAAGKLADHLSALELAEANKKEGKTIGEIEAEAKAKAAGTAAGTPPKNLTDIEAESAARARGAASVKEDSFDKNLLVAAQAAGIPPKKVKDGKLTPEEAQTLAKEYSKQFGTESLIKMLFGGGVGVPGTQSDVIQFDEKGNPIKK
jgi:hypothetical protein